MQIEIQSRDAKCSIIQRLFEGHVRVSHCLGAAWPATVSLRAFGGNIPPFNPHGPDVTTRH